MQSRFFRFNFSQIFGIDVRSLALFRLGLSLVLLWDLGVRASNIAAFYTDAGVLPRKAQIELYANIPALLSLHLLGGTLAAQWLLFALAFGAALCLLVGYRTFWATLVSWVLLVSLHNRNPMTLQGGDVLMRLLLFWSLFLPLGARASLDAWLAPPSKKLTSGPDGKAPPKHELLVSTGTLAILLQICFVYWFTAALKTDASWRVDGTAVAYALSIDQLATPLGHSLLGYPKLLRALTFGTLWLERFGPFLALLPFWRLRTFMVLVFAGFHFAIGACLTLGIFTWIAPTAWLLFLPAGFWDALEEHVALRWLPRLDRLRYRVIGFCLRWGLRGVLPSRPVPWKATFNQGVCALLLLYVLAWNLRTLDPSTYGFSQGWNWIGDGARLDQMWDMFAPFPLKDDGWFLAPATLANGRQINLMSGGAPVSWQQPAHLSSTFRDAQWQKYLLNLWSVSNEGHRRYYVEFLARQWNETHGAREQVKALQLVYMRQMTLATLRKEMPRKFVLWRATF